MFQLESDYPIPCAAPLSQVDEVEDLQTLEGAPQRWHAATLLVSLVQVVVHLVQSLPRVVARMEEEECLSQAPQGLAIQGVRPVCVVCDLPTPFLACLLLPWYHTSLASPAEMTLSC